MPPRACSSHEDGVLTVVRDETVATEDPVSVDGSFVGYTTDVERIARVGTDDTL